MNEISRAAKAATTKRNNKARRDYPLFSDNVLSGMGLLTTANQEQERLNKSHTAADAHLAEIERSNAERDRTLPVLIAWGEKILPDNYSMLCKRREQACPAGYGWDIWSNALANHLDVPYLDMWRALRKFCNLPL